MSGMYGRFDTIDLKKPGLRSAHLYEWHPFLPQAFRSELKYLDLVKIFAKEFDFFLRVRGIIWVRPDSGRGADRLGSQSDGAYAWEFSRKRSHRRSFGAVH